MSKAFLSIRDMCYIAIFTAAIVTLSQIRIPMPLGVPLTLQTFVIPLAGVVLGAKRGALSVCVYVLLGLLGLPVFSGGGAISGFGALFGVTGGFIFAFPLYAFAAGWGADRNDTALLFIGLFSGMIVTYLLGMIQFSLVTGHGFRVARSVVVWPFLPTELLKLAGVWIVGPRIRRQAEGIGT